MAKQMVLHLSSLPVRHPKVHLEMYACMAVIRLKRDSSSFQQTLAIDHRPPKTNESNVLSCEINLEIISISEKDLAKIPNTTNAHDITEKAAIVIMALLVSDLEKIQISSVLQIGSGGDYIVRMKKNDREVQVEVSGIDKGKASNSSSRLNEKSKQVLKKADAGYVSVTTFRQRCGEGDIAHSYLHYVESK